MRIFIGIELDEKVKKYLDNINKIFMSNNVSGNFTDKNNFHITIKYIGEVSQEQFEVLKTCVDLACRNIKPFKISIKNLGKFNKKTSNIIWMGIEKGNEYLQKLFHQIEYELSYENFLLEQKTFQPHITLGKKIYDIKLDQKFKEYEEEILIKKCTIFLSHRINGTLIYTPLYSCEF